MLSQSPSPSPTDSSFVRGAQGEQQQSSVSSAYGGLGLPGQYETSAGWAGTERATRKGSINTLTGNNGECTSGPYQRRKQKPDNDGLAGVANAGLVPATIKMLLLTRFSMDVSKFKGGAGALGSPHLT